MTNFNTPGTPEAFSPNVQAFAAADVIPDALPLLAGTQMARIDGDAPQVLVPFLDADDDAGFFAEGATITEGSPVSRQVAISTGKIAVLEAVSHEQYAQDGIAALMSQAVQRALVRRANVAFLSQAAPVSPATTPPAGLLNLNPTDGGVISDDLDALVEAVATIEANWGQATNIIAAPDAWSFLRRLKNATGSNASLIGAGTNDAQRMLLDLPVYVTPAMPTGGVLVLDKAAVLTAVGPVSLAVSEDAYFASDSVGVRATFRFGQALADVKRVVSLTTVGDGE